jgi:misacylated tRNA(Ala) deacylase
VRWYAMRPPSSLHEGLNRGSLFENEPEFTLAVKRARMARYLCHDEPDLLAFEADVVDARPGMVLLSRSAFYPGGGGQLPDRGAIEWPHGVVAVTGFEEHDARLWITLAEPVELHGSVLGRVDQEFRHMMAQLHTNLHVVNAFVFQRFGGALVTGVQMAADNTARIDFDLPGADNDLLRALEPEFNAIIRQDLSIVERFVPEARAEEEPGLIRSKAVAPPPQPDGTIRVIEIGGLDRQACGGTHLRSTGESRPVKIVKIDNKGRQNRRIRIGLA